MMVSLDDSSNAVPLSLHDTIEIVDLNLEYKGKKQPICVMTTNYDFVFRPNAALVLNQQVYKEDIIERILRVKFVKGTQLTHHLMQMFFMSPVSHINLRTN